jgi:uncharacterized protein with von Willebrand factor type A (vWA) domain
LDQETFRQVLEAVWCKRAEDIAWFRMAFGQWVLLLNHPSSPSVQETYLASLARQRRDPGVLANPSWYAPRPGQPNVQALAITQGSSRREVLAGKRLERLTDDELFWLMGLYRPRVALTEPTYLQRPESRGTMLNPGETMRQGREGTEWVRLYFDRRVSEPLHLTVLLDMSGSTAAAHRPFLQFLHAMMRHQRHLTVYGFSTRLTSLTQALRQFSVDRALADVAVATPDRGGGTRIADSLEALWRRERGRGLTARSTLVLISDGFEEGDGLELGRWASRLNRYVHGRFFWWIPFMTGDPHQVQTPSVTALAAQTRPVPVTNFRDLNQAWNHLDRRPAV